MSDNFPSDVKLNENPNGTVSFATEVIATIAGLAATEVDGVASMTSPSTGLADMFTRKSNRSLTKGVRIDLEENRVAVDITITVDYGSPVPDVAHSIQENVKKAIETMSGLDVKNVDVHVTGISFEREQRANAELDEQHRKMLEKTVEEKAAEPAEPRNMASEVVCNEDDEDEDDDDYDEDDEDDFDDDIDEDDIPDADGEEAPASEAVSSPEDAAEAEKAPLEDDKDDEGRSYRA